MASGGASPACPWPDTPALPAPEGARPPELAKAKVHSWSHLNSDKPILHSHALKISRFRQCLDQFETSMFIQDSFSVSVAGVRTNWELRVYPNGYDDENSNYLGIFVKHKEGNSHQYMIKSVIQLLDAQGERKVPVELPGKILSSKQMHGTKKYIEREVLLTNPALYSEDSITFLLEAEICQPGTRVSAEEGAVAGVEAAAGETPLSRDLVALLRGGDHADVRLVVGERQFPCHSNILAARSPVFAAMFAHDMQESRRGLVDISDVAAPTLATMLDWLYGAPLPQEALSPQLLAAADKYDLADLKAQCETSLARGLSLTSCLETIILADQHSATSLKSSALAFIVRNLATIVSDAGWQVQLAGHPHLMAQIIQSMANMPSSHSSSHSSHSASHSSSSPQPKKRRKELRVFKEAILSAMRSSDEEEL